MQKRKSILPQKDVGSQGRHTTASTAKFYAKRVTSTLRIFCRRRKTRIGPSKLGDALQNIINARTPTDRIRSRAVFIFGTHRRVGANIKLHTAKHRKHVHRPRLASTVLFFPSWTQSNIVWENTTEKYFFEIRSEEPGRRKAFLASEYSLKKDQ